MIKTNTTLNSGFDKFFTWISFLRWEIKTDTAQTGFRVLHVFLINNSILGLLSKSTFSRLKVVLELLSKFQNFNFKKFVPNTGNKFNEIVKMIVSYYIYTNHFDRPDIKETTCTITNFYIVTSIRPKYYCTQLTLSH